MVRATAFVLEGETKGTGSVKPRGKSFGGHGDLIVVFQYAEVIEMVESQQ